MRNLAGDKEADDKIREELFCADILAVPSLPHNDEVPHKVSGLLAVAGYVITFLRGWVYWRVRCEPPLPLDLATALDAAPFDLSQSHYSGHSERPRLGDVVRVDGYAGGTRPDEPTGFWHVDTLAGLVAMARWFRALPAAEGVPPDLAPLLSAPITFDRKRDITLCARCGARWPEGQAPGAFTHRVPGTRPEDCRRLCDACVEVLARADIAAPPPTEPRVGRWIAETTWACACVLGEDMQGKDVPTCHRCNTVRPPRPEVPRWHPDGTQWMCAHGANCSDDEACGQGCVRPPRDEVPR